MPPVDAETAAVLAPIVTDRELAELVETLIASERYAIDTEFHRERSYYPQVALLQFAWDDKVALVDPLAVNVKPLAALLTFLKNPLLLSELPSFLWKVKNSLSSMNTFLRKWAEDGRMPRR